MIHLLHIEGGRGQSDVSIASAAVLEAFLQERRTSSSDNNYLSEQTNTR